MDNVVEKFEAECGLSVESTYSDLIEVYSTYRDSRLQAEKKCHAIKKIEDHVKQLMLNKLIAEDQQSAKTSIGTVYQESSKSLVTEDAESFKNWLRKGIIASFTYWAVNNPETGLSVQVDQVPALLARYLSEVQITDSASILKAAPYSQPVLRQAIGDDGTPPDGVKWESRREARVRKS